MATASAPPKTDPTEAAKTVCGAERRHGGTCRNRAGFKTDHVGFGACHLHSGSTANGRKHAARLRVADLVKDAPIDGRDAIERALSKLNGLVVALDQETTNGRLVTAKGVLNPLVTQLTSACRELAQIGKLAADAGVDERRIRLDEQLAEQFATAIEKILAGHGITSAQRKPDVIRAALVVLEGGRVAA